MDINGELAPAILYPPLTGQVAIGGRVLLNTTAIALKLGTGGYHFVNMIAGKEEKELLGPGHIMKLRYTPYQFKVHAWEEEEKGNQGKPPLVLAISLHSMLAPLAITLKECGCKNICYIMTDAGALPLGFSKIVRQLKKKNYLKLTITAGQAFGGDLETVNIYTGILAAASEACSLVIIGPGPGHVGTGSKWGFSGIEQGEILNGAALLACPLVGIPRLSFQDKRSRHLGISHHSLTALGEVCRVQAKIFLPKLKGARGNLIAKQAQAFQGKDVCYLPISVLGDILKKNSSMLNMMGRGFHDDPLYFITCALGAWGAYKYLEGMGSPNGEKKD